MLRKILKFKIKLNKFKLENNRFFFIISFLMESDDDVPNNQIPASDGLEEIHTYMVHHKMEENMNELINDTLKVRPEDPYLYMSELLRDKSSVNKGIRRCTARKVYGLYIVFIY